MKAKEARPLRQTLIPLGAYRTGTFWKIHLINRPESSGWTKAINAGFSFLNTDLAMR